MPHNIFILEDDTALRAVVREDLQMSGYDVREEGTMAGLRSRFDESSPDVLLLDLELPDGHGLDLLPEVKRHWPRVQVVILTGHGTVEVAESAFRSGEVFLLSKPFDSELLKGVLDLALAARK